jgi:hypothetical protein
MSGIIGIAGLLAAIESRAVIGRQRISLLQPARQIGIGNEDAPERDGVGMAGGDSGFRRLAGESAGRNQDTNTIAEGTF